VLARNSVLYEYTRSRVEVTTPDKPELAAAYQQFQRDSAQRFGGGAI
jgi:hypothetical protein